MKRNLKKKSKGIRMTEKMDMFIKSRLLISKFKKVLIGIKKCQKIKLDKKKISGKFKYKGMF